MQEDQVIAALSKDVILGWGRRILVGGTRATTIFKGLFFKYTHDLSSKKKKKLGVLRTFIVITCYTVRYKYFLITRETKLNI